MFNNLIKWNKVRMAITIALFSINLILYYSMNKTELLDTWIIVSGMISVFLLFYYFIMNKCNKLFEASDETIVIIDIKNKIYYTSAYIMLYIILMLSIIEFNAILFSLIIIINIVIVMIEPGYYDIKDFNKYKVWYVMNYDLKIIFCSDIAFMAHVIIISLCISLPQISYIMMIVTVIGEILFLGFIRSIYYKDKIRTKEI